MIERHWDGIAAYCRPENKVSLGFVEYTRPWRARSKRTRRIGGRNMGKQTAFAELFRVAI